MSRSHWYLALALLALAVVSLPGLIGCQAAQAKYPSKPIAVTIPNAAGTTLDIFGRQVTALSEKVLKVSMPVEARPGGGGTTALTYIKSQAADGYNISVSSSNMAYIFAKPDTPVAADDFVWINRMVGDSACLYVPADGKIKTLEDFVAAAKASPTGLKVGGGGSGQTNDYAASKFAQLAGIKTPWVAFDGTPSAIAAALGGHIDALNMTTAAGQVMVRDGKLRPLAVTSTKRVPFWPDVPTFKEKGYDLDITLWRGFLAKKGTPPEVVKILHDTFKDITAAPEWADFLNKVGSMDLYLNTEDATRQMNKETEEARGYLKEIGAIN